MKTKHYREVRCEDRLPDESRDYLTSRGWMAFSKNLEEFYTQAELLKWGLPGSDKCVQPRFWLEPFDPEAEAEERLDAGWDHFTSMPKFIGTNEQVSEAANEWINESFKIASGKTE